MARLRAGGTRNRRRLGVRPGCSSRTNQKFNIEFVALANHRKAIRTEIARYAERYRAAQLEHVTGALRQIGVTDDQLPPVVALLLMMGVTQVMALEDALGVTAGHETTTAFIARTIARVDPPSADS